MMGMNWSYNERFQAKIFQKMEAKSIIGWAIGGVTLLILSIFALIVYLKRKTIFRCKD